MFESTVPFVAERMHAAAVYCSDGRWGAQVAEFLTRGLALPRYDRLAIPGGAGPLAGHLVTWKEEQALVHQLGLLIEVHSLDRVVLVAHQDCAFYTVRLRIAGEDLERQQRADLDAAAHRIVRMHAGVRVDAWFARRDGPKVTFEEWRPT